MICPTCGINSSTEDVCSFCKHPFPQKQAAPPPPVLPMMPIPAPPTVPVAPALPPQPTMGLPPHPGAVNPAMPTQAMQSQPMQAMPPQYANAPAPPNYLQPTQQMPQMPTTQQRVSLTGEVIEVNVAPPPMQGAYPGQPTTPNLPGYVERYTPVREIESVVAPAGECWEKFLAIGLPILALSMLGVHLYPGMALGIAIADLFFLSVAISGTCAIPSYDDSIADVGIGVALAFLFGPFIAGISLFIKGLIQQEPATSVLSLLSLVFFVEITLGVVLSSNPNAQLGAKVAFFGMFGFLSLVAFLITLAGWMIGNLFRPVGESI